MSDDELKVTLKCILRGSATGQMQMTELTKEFEKHETEKLDFAAKRYGYENVYSMLRSWPEFKIFENGMNTSVKVLETDHITELNQRSK